MGDLTYRNPNPNPISHCAPSLRWAHLGPRSPESQAKNFEEKTGDCPGCHFEGPISNLGRESDFPPLQRDEAIAKCRRPSQMISAEHDKRL